MNYRPERVSSLIKQELSSIIIKSVEFPAGHLVTITKVEVDKKLEHAKIGISVLPSEGATKVLSILEKVAGHLQYLLMKRVNIKPLPRIIFEIDHGIEKLAKIEKLLIDDKIKDRDVV